MIKAIETEYNGYRFRSRLEARWAVFFDALGIKYEYESEGYDLGEYGRYLPDFWLPVNRWHVEIKPENVTPEELKRAQYFDDFPPNGSMGVIMLIGAPNPTPEAGQEMWQGELRDNYLGSWSNVESICVRCNLPFALGYQAAAKARSARFEFGQTPIIK